MKLFLSFLHAVSMINDDQSSEIGIGNCDRDLHMYVICRDRILMPRRAAIIDRIPSRRHLLTLLRKIWKMLHIIWRISLMQIYGPGTGLTRVLRFVSFRFISFFSHYPWLSCHRKYYYNNCKLSNCRSRDRCCEEMGGGERSPWVRMLAH